MKRNLLMMMIICMVLALSGCACKHESTTVVNATQASCVEEGYTGDTVCTECNEVVVSGKTIPAVGHNVKLLSATEPSCTMNGYTGDESCTVCWEVIKAGEVIPMLDHTPGESENPIEATCTSKGRTGDIRCTVCNKILTGSETLEMLPHTPGEPYGTGEPTCTVAGYTGDAACTACGEIIYGSAIPRLEHAWVDGCCKDCGWIEPGLYVDGVMQMDWDALVSGNYLTFEDNGNLDAVHEALYGLLVLSEDLPGFEVNAFSGSKLDEVYVPATITEMAGFTFASSEIKTVRFFGAVTDLGYASFDHCNLLESIVIPSSVTEIPKKCFWGCQSLHTVELPENLESIGEFAFSDTESLTSITFPEGLESIGYEAFSNSGLVSVTLPASVQNVSMGAFDRCANLTSMDMSACAVTNLFEIVKGSVNLEDYKLPHSLIEGKGIMDDEAKVEHLVIPDGVEVLTIAGVNHIYPNEHLRSIVWPVSLKKADNLVYAEALETIYYRGSEFEWSIVEGCAEFENVEVVFNYEGD